jgi:hypothetical protein
MGGLGNQLFQIFTALSYSLKHNSKIIFPYTETLNTGRTRTTYWDTFLTNFDVLTTRNDFHKITNDVLFSFQMYRENGFQYKELPLFESNTLLYGYFQSYKYFKENQKLIFTLMDLHERQNDIKTKYGNLFLDCHAISMHFRLGDYKNIQHVHPIMCYQYYKTALNLIVNTRQDIENLRVLYFCEEEDNIEVLKTIIGLQKEYPLIEFMKVDDKILDWEQMLIMSCCFDNIIANSSFSWWGAQFNTEETKLVCYPNKWFGPANTSNTNDLFPETWKRIEI